MLIFSLLFKFCFFFCSLLLFLSYRYEFVIKYFLYIIFISPIDDKFRKRSFSSVFLLSSFPLSQSPPLILLSSVPPSSSCSSVLLALTIVHFSLFTITKLLLPRIWSATFRFWFTFYYLCSWFGLSGGRSKHSLRVMWATMQVEY